MSSFLIAPTPNRACAKAALEGCLQLLSSHASSFSSRPAPAVRMAQALASHVQLPSLTVSGRQLGLQLWLKLLQARACLMAAAPHPVVAWHCN